MSSFFGKLRNNTTGLGVSNGASSSRKDATVSPQTPLEKLLEGAGPIRDDGSDKFWGMENFGNTCYANSVLQCLFHSVPFRDQLIRFPKRTPSESLRTAANEQPKAVTTPSSPVNGTVKPSAANPASAQPRRGGPQTTVVGPVGVRPEDKPDTPEYKKKHAMLAGPILSMDYENSKTYGMEESLCTALKDLFEGVIAHSSRTGVVSPQKVLEVLKRDNEMFRSTMHQDAHEFLNFLLNEVMAAVETSNRAANDPQISLNGSEGTVSLDSIMASAAAKAKAALASKPLKSASWVHDLFEGTLTSETRCLTCENISHRDEPFLDLSVDLEQHTSVTACLRKFSEEEMLCERNKFHCDNCGGLQEAEKRMKIKRLPRVLALHLKRFKYTEDLQRLQKLFHRVVYPYHLRLFNTTDDAEDPDRLYELYAVVVHIGGGPYHGHYVSIIKTVDRGWLLFDDEMVEPVDKSYVKNFFGDKPGLACAYVLFYQETTLEAVRKEQEAEDLASATVAQPTKDLLAVKANGHLPSSPLAPSYSVNTPAMDESGHLSKLEQTMSAPVRVSIKPGPLPTEVEPTAASPHISIVSPKPGGIKSRKERAEEDKRNKMADKEREKAERARAKSMDIQRKEIEKKQRVDVKATRRLSRTDDDGLAIPDVGEKTRKESSNGTASAIVAGGLNRFRQSSKSMRRTKLWGSKGKDEANRDGVDTFPIEVSNVPSLGANGHNGDAVQPPSPLKTKTSRFNLKKPSVFS